jgi:hypothetical protein
VRVFFSRGMMLNQRAMQIQLGGFWKLRWLKVFGVMPPPACCG